MDGSTLPQPSPNPTLSPLLPWIWPQGYADCRFSIDLDGFATACGDILESEDTGDEQYDVADKLDEWPFLTNKGVCQSKYKATSIEYDTSLGIAPLIQNGAFNLQGLPKRLREHIGPASPDHSFLNIDIRGSHTALAACMSGCAAMIEACKGDFYSQFGGGDEQRTANKRAWNAFINGAGLEKIKEMGHPDPDGFYMQARALASGPYAPAFRWMDLGAARCIEAGIQTKNGPVTSKNARAVFMQRIEAYTVYRALVAIYGDKERADRWQLSTVLVNHDGLLLSCLHRYAEEALALVRELIAKAITNDVSPDVDVWTKGAVQARWDVDLIDEPFSPATGLQWSVDVRKKARAWIAGWEASIEAARSRPKVDIPPPSPIARHTLVAAIDLGAVLKTDMINRDMTRIFNNSIERKERAIVWLRQTTAAASGFPLVEATGRAGSAVWLKQVLSQDKSFPVLRYDNRANIGRVDGRQVDDRTFRTLFFDGLASRYGFYADADNSAVGLVVEDIGFTSNQYDPVQEWFEALPAWDGVGRVSNWVERYCRPVLPSTLDDGTKKKLAALYNTYGAKMLISLVARTYKPGCEVHTSLILSGKQGTGKTSLFKLLAPAGSYAAMSIDPTNKDSVIEVSRYALVEWGELSGLKKADMERLKDYWTKTFDDVRTPYARRSIVLPRRGIIVGSDNSGAIFTDPTGGRRFWVVPNGPIDLPGIEAIIPQLWAEALAIYRKGIAENQKELWYLSDDEAADKQEGDAFFTLTDPHAEAVERLLDQWAKVPSTHPRSDRLLTVGALCHGLGVKVGEQGKVTQELVRTLKRMGYEPQQLGGGDRARYWVKAED